jgi:hypothetical protein
VNVAAVRSGLARHPPASGACINAANIVVVVAQFETVLLGRLEQRGKSVDTVVLQVFTFSTLLRPSQMVMKPFTFSQPVGLYVVRRRNSWDSRGLILVKELSALESAITLDVSPV